MTWTDERVELLKKLWADGLSASRIAAELGGVSRNSVIGKVHRLGLSGRAKSASASVPRQRKPRVQHMMRIARPGVRGNTALAPMHVFETENRTHTPTAPAVEVAVMRRGPVHFRRVLARETRGCLAGPPARDRGVGRARVDSDVALVRFDHVRTT